MASSRITPSKSSQPEAVPWWESSAAVWVAAVLICLAGWVAYTNGLATPFIFDDTEAIVKNPTIRHLGALREVFSPPQNGETVSGRPLLNFSLALNYALGGQSVRGYHVTNLVIHLSAALLLFGLVRRTLQRSVLRANFGGMAMPLAFVAALLWVVHPLQTESVTYIVQRAESLAGFFYLLTLYAFVRGVEKEEQTTRGGGQWNWWQAVAVLACLLGMATKEILVTAPVVVFLYDRTFVAGTFAGAWRQRRWFYLTMMATWLWLGWLVAGTGNRGGSAGVGTDVTWSAYALTQCAAVANYIGLALWPRSLVFDYGAGVVANVNEVLPQALLLLLLAAGTIFALTRSDARLRAAGFLGACFFLILAPSSSVVPIATQTMAEHRMYLPLAAVVLLVVLGAYTFLGWRVLVAGLALAAGLGWLTAQRNLDYRSDEVMWRDIIAKRHDQPRAHYNLGYVLVQQGKLPEAMAEFQEALRIKPDYADAEVNWGNALQMSGNFTEAEKHFQAAIRLRPDDSEARYNLGNVLMQAGNISAAMAQFQVALTLMPDSAPAHNLLGLALARQNHPEQAMQEYQTALRFDPEFAEAHLNLGNALFKLNRLPEAVAAYRAAVKLAPTNPITRNNLGLALFQSGQFAEARREYEEAVRLRPDYAEARTNLSNLKVLLDALPPGAF